MVTMFPSVCQDWLVGRVQACTVPPPDGGEVLAVEGPRPPLTIAAMDLRFQTTVEEIFLLSLEDRGKLPTRLQWEARQKQRSVSCIGLAIDSLLTGVQGGAGEVVRGDVGEGHAGAVRR
jgi:hypothetical protein